MPAEAPSATARARLAAMQAELVAALTGKAATPAGFCAHRIRAAAVSLAVKRRGAVARAWPGLAEELGAHYAERFAAYASLTPLPSSGGPLADGRVFVDWLERRGERLDGCRLQAMAVDLRHARTANGLVPRRGASLRIARLGNPRRLVVGLRLPWLGERWLQLPF